jgi:glycosyltransferase involved in cell wall biosynthesis
VSPPPDVTIVIPIHNEEPILTAALLELRDRLVPCAWSREIVLAENGSRDRTAEVASELAARFPEVSTFSVGEPNYGRALRLGIERARGAIVICEEIDLCDVGFHQAAVSLLQERPVDGPPIDMVIGSKLLAGSADERPWLRHAASQLYNALLRVGLGFRGTDTHGLKALRKSAVGPIAARCVVDKDVFASELVIRAYREGCNVREIPVHLHEKRTPSINLLRRVPNVVRSLGKLAWAIRVKG